MKQITICLPYYRNRGMLVEQCRRLRNLPLQTKQFLRLIVVDDGSTILQSDEKELPPMAMAAEYEDIGLPFQLFRMTVNVRWNQDACRNLAVKHAYTDWLLLTDIDHIPPKETLESLIATDHDPNRIYRFGRATLMRQSTPERDELSEYKPHPNSWLMTRAMYWKMGGYDERFAGYYGTDADFRDRAEAASGAIVPLSEILIRVPRDVIPDASTTTYERKSDEDEALKGMRKRRNLTPGWKPIHFSFPWERVVQP